MPAQNWSVELLRPAQARPNIKEAKFELYSVAAAEVTPVSFEYTTYCTVTDSPHCAPVLKRISSAVFE